MIKTLQDATFPAAAQQTFAESSGVDWQIVDVDGGHEAIGRSSLPDIFLSGLGLRSNGVLTVSTVTIPQAVVDAVLTAVKQWTE